MSGTVTNLGVAGTVTPLIRRRPNTWHAPELRTEAAVANAAVVADTAYAFPLFIDQPASIAEIAIVVGTAVAGVWARMALYTCNPDTLAPLSLIQGSTMDLDMNATAGSAQSMLLSPGPFYMPGGILMAVAKFNGAAQPRTLATAGNGSGNTLWQKSTGAASPLLALGGTGNLPSRLTATNTYAAAWPTLWAAADWTMGVGAPGAPLFAWRSAQ